MTRRMMGTIPRMHRILYTRTTIDGIC